MELTLGQAAKLTGNGKTTLARAIKAGRLSATRRDDGSYAIDASELARVYHMTPEAGSPTGYAARRAPVELRAMKDMLAEIRQSRDHWQAQAERLALAAPIIATGPSESPRRAWFGWQKAG